MDIAAGKQHVVRRHVAMDSPQSMRCAEAGCEPAQEAREILGRHLALAHHVGKLGALDKLGHDVEHAELRLLREHAIGHDRFVLQFGEGPRLLAEHRDDLLVRCELGQHDLDRDPLVGVDVHALEHLSHAASGKEALHLEDMVEDVADLDFLCLTRHETARRAAARSFRRRLGRLLCGDVARDGRRGRRHCRR